jgi:hypothetical protein
LTCIAFSFKDPEIFMYEITTSEVFFIITLEREEVGRHNRQNKIGHEFIIIGCTWNILLLHMFEIFPNKKFKEDWGCSSVVERLAWARP